MERPSTQQDNEKRYLVLYMRSQAERIRATIEELSQWAMEIEQTAERLEEQETEHRIQNTGERS